MIRVPLPKKRKPHDPLEAASRQLQQFRSRTKLKILLLIAEKGVGCPTDIAKQIGVGRSAVLMALKRLREEGVVKAQWETHDSMRRAYTLVPTSGLAMIVLEMYKKCGGKILGGK